MGMGQVRGLRDLASRSKPSSAFLIRLSRACIRQSDEFSSSLLQLNQLDDPLHHHQAARLMREDRPPILINIPMAENFEIAVASCPFFDDFGHDVVDRQDFGKATTVPDEQMNLREVLTFAQRVRQDDVMVHRPERFLELGAHHKQQRCSAILFRGAVPLLAIGHAMPHDPLDIVFHVDCMCGEIGNLNVRCRHIQAFELNPKWLLMLSYPFNQRMSALES
ncbi:MAG: hypothetical protein JSS54_12785 [Proteobacteria bacterium]|nr:hypothetical protein [Pseudomonadota bacterium]